MFPWLNNIKAHVHVHEWRQWTVFYMALFLCYWPLKVIHSKGCIIQSLYTISLLLHACQTFRVTSGCRLEKPRDQSTNLLVSGRSARPAGHSCLFPQLFSLLLFLVFSGQSHIRVAERIRPQLHRQYLSLISSLLAVVFLWDLLTWKYKIMLGLSFAVPSLLLVRPQVESGRSCAQ